VLALPIVKAMWFAERLLKERKAEAKAIRNAQKKK
jgi:hypothetical protein